MYTIAKRLAVPTAAFVTTFALTTQLSGSKPAFLETAQPKLVGVGNDSAYRLVPIPVPFKANHAIYENVVHPNGVIRYNVYRSPADQEGKEICLADLKFGTKVNGHHGIVHGGITSLLYDDVFGFAYFMASGGLFGYTANLSVNYRTPLPENTEAVMRVTLDKIERRKVMLKARLESKDGEIMYSEATALYIIDKSMKKMKLGPELTKFIDESPS